MDYGPPEQQGREVFQLPVRLIEALISYVDYQKPTTSRSAVMRLALKEFAARWVLATMDD
jgi:hypothetical protein